jgi:hypothetical protein
LKIKIPYSVQMEESRVAGHYPHASSTSSLPASSWRMIWSLPFIFVHNIRGGAVYFRVRILASDSGVRLRSLSSDIAIDNVKKRIHDKMSIPPDQ